MRARTPLLLSAAGLVMLACHHAPQSAPVPKAKRGPDYLGWRRVTPYPQHLAPALNAMCDSPPEYRMKSPHKDKVFHVYVNKIGEKAMFSVRTESQKSPPVLQNKDKPNEFPDVTETIWAYEMGPNEVFPDGSIIVKEKWPRDAFGPDLTKSARPKTEPELLTVMTKTKGKWVYSVVQNGEIQAGDMKHCTKCHESAKVTDYVFRSYQRR